MNYEKGNKETIIVKNGDSWTGVDGFWDSEKQQWYKITDNIDVELTPDGGVRWSPGKHATPGGKFEENQMNKKGGYQSDIPEEWPDPVNSNCKCTGESLVKNLGWSLVV